MTSYAISIKDSQIEVSFAGVFGEDSRTEVGVVVIDLAEKHGPLTLKAVSAEEFKATCGAAHTVITREALRLLSERIKEVAPHLIEAGS